MRDRPAPKSPGRRGTDRGDIPETSPSEGTEAGGTHDLTTPPSRGTAERGRLVIHIVSAAAGTPQEVSGYDERARRLAMRDPRAHG